MIVAGSLRAKTGRVQGARSSRVSEPITPHVMAPFDVAGYVLREFLHRHRAVGSDTVSTGTYVRRAAY